jgi:ABC-type Fe3+-siderophore transport system permease subunit
VEELYNYKRLIGELSGATIAVVWISYALLGPGNMVFLVVAISLTILLGVLSGGLIGLSKKEIDYKEVVGWLLGATIAVVWISYALLGPGNMVFLVVAISLTILLGVLSSGLIALSKKDKVS